MMPQQPAGVQWKRSHDCGQAQPNSKERPSSASACYARPQRVQQSAVGATTTQDARIRMERANNLARRNAPGLNEAKTLQQTKTRWRNQSPSRSHEAGRVSQRQGNSLASAANASS